MEKLINMNVHGATLKQMPKIILNFFPICFLVYENKIHAKINELK